MPRILGRRLVLRAPSPSVFHPARLLDRHLAAAIAAPAPVMARPGSSAWIAPAPAAPEVSGVGDKMEKIEIKGLSDAVRAARAVIADSRQKTADVHVAGQALNATLLDIRRQIEEAHADLRAEASALGNSPPPPAS